MSSAAIINADDFGLSPGVNRGILECFRRGVLTSTTMMVNMDAFDEAVRLARENPDLPVGIHLSLLWGPPVTPAEKVRSLVGRDGCFPRSLAGLASRYFLRLLSPDEMRRELRNQIRRFLDTGLTPTHVDTHKHVHCLPGVLEALLAAAAEFGIEKVRWPSEERPACPASWKASAKRRLIRFFCGRGRPVLERGGFRTTDLFAGIEHSGSLNSTALNLILSHLKGGVTEIMCHPGYSDEGARRYSSAALQRETELQSLNDPRVREHVASNAIRLIHYGDL